ncbi:MAG: serine/threonine-protein kinase [Planctomycetaceae bacterium]
MKQPSEIECPAVCQLEDLLELRLSGPDAAAVSQHVENCNACQRQLESMTHESVPAIGTLREQPQGRWASLSDPVSDIGFCETATVRSGGTSTLEITLPEIPGYRVDRLLGRGGMGTVFLAHHALLNRLVAIKLLPQDSAGRQSAVARFLREITVAGRLDHVNIVRALDAIRDGERHFLVMEFVEGQTLAEILFSSGRPAVADVCEVIRQAAVGLQYAHEHGMVHRDIKPSNLMVTTTGVVKILDLGLAKLAHHPGDELTSTGDIIGTIDFMAPEQADPGQVTDGRADIFSLGVTFFKLLTGTVPFGPPLHDSALNKLFAITRGDGPSVATLRSDLPQELIDIVDRMRRRKAEDRFQSFTEVIAVLRPHCEGNKVGQLVSESNIHGAAPIRPDDMTRLQEQSNAQDSTSENQNPKTRPEHRPAFLAHADAAAHSTVVDIRTENTRVRSRGPRRFIAAACVVGVALVALPMLEFPGAGDRNRSATSAVGSSPSAASPDVTRAVSVNVPTPDESGSAAEWLLNHGAGWVNVRVHSDLPGRTIRCTEVNQLPEDPVVVACGVNANDMNLQKESASSGESNWIEVLRNCPELRVLLVDTVTPADMHDVIALQQLTRLEIRCLQADAGDFSFVRQMPNVNILSIVDPKKTKADVVVDEIPALLRELPGIHSLVLNGVDFRNGVPAFLKRLPASLTHLEIAAEQLDDSIWPLLAEHEQLIEIRMRFEGLTCEGIHHLGRMPQLRYLGVLSWSLTRRGVEELGSLTQLHGLCLADTNMRDDWMHSVHNLKSMRKAELEGTQVTAAAATKLKRALPRCEITYGPLLDPHTATTD